jgi:signal transduction histidine kinase
MFFRPKTSPSKVSGEGSQDRPSADQKGLSAFIKENQPAIIKDWEEFAKAHIAPAKDMDKAALQDHVSSILKFIVMDMNSAQTKHEKKEKSEGEGAKAGGGHDSAAEIHADVRFIEGFDALELMAEFRALRASIVRLWEPFRSKTEKDYEEMVRFNEAIDQVSSEGFIRYTEKANHARSLFLGTLVHDLRNPLGAVSLAAQILHTTPNLDDRQKKLTDQIYISTSRVVKLVTDLIDDVRARLGKGLPIDIHPMDIEDAIELAVSEIEIVYPDRKISVWTEGDLEGEWDSSRIAQLLSNLIGNAIQHGRTDSTIEVVAKGKPEEVLISVHNYGMPIPSTALLKIFEPMFQGGPEAVSLPNAPNSLGLGLFIVKEIATAHGGQVNATSSEEEGTTLIVRLPRAVKA